jgi:hypothetical protein
MKFQSIVGGRSRFYGPSDFSLVLWNPYQEDDVFFEQSAGMFGVSRQDTADVLQHYIRRTIMVRLFSLWPICLAFNPFKVQILAHRPFIQASNASVGFQFKWRLSSLFIA